MMIHDWYSFKGGREVVETKRLLKEIEEIANSTDELKDKESKNVARQYDWVPEKTIVGGYDWSYDAYKNGIAIEFERGHQTKARWNWMKFELGNKDNSGLMELVDLPEVDVGVLLVTWESGGANIDRCRDELESGIFDTLLDIDVPILVGKFDDT